MSVYLAALQFEHHESGFGIAHSQPRISWRFGSTEEKNWRQSAYEIEIDRGGDRLESYKVTSAQSSLVQWPASPLSSRERVGVRVRAFGEDGTATNWVEGRVEAAFLDRNDWVASLITGAPQPPDSPKRPVRFRKAFELPSSFERQRSVARLYVTAYGIYETVINGRTVGNEVLSPGWTVYRDRLRYQIHDITSLLKPGNNTVGAYVGEGWYAGRIGNRGARNVWGDTLAFFAQLEVDGKLVVATDESWEWLEGPITRSEIYDGEDIDSQLSDPEWLTSPEFQGQARVLPTLTAQLIASDAPPVRRVMEVKAVGLVTTPSGRKVLDFGQNLVGWLRADEEFAQGRQGEVIIRHAEVMEDGELGVRPLRTAAATDRIKLGGLIKGWEPKFTFHGFRYAEVTGLSDLTLSTFTAVVISSDLRRTGEFECSHEMINRLHQNVVWSMRGNFVSVPTDCPQRDERLGWTGDIQVFGPTANYLYDTSAFLAEWLWDLDSEQKKHNGVPPFVIPDVPMRPTGEAVPHSVWADVTALLPRDLYLSTADTVLLSRQFESMCDWLDKGIPRQEDGLWDNSIAQFADWLDPRAPPLYPAHGLTDTHLVANAYLIHTTQTVARIADILGKTVVGKKYHEDADKLLKLFQAEYVSPNGRPISDTQTALALALQFDLLEPQHRKKAADRLAYITRWWSFKISTGFAGTPIILQALADNGYIGLAYRMLQEKHNPSWLYPVGMGATTIWERWDSMLEDGKINPGTMTSFNHYALGAVANFLHNTVAGLSSTTPGWKEAVIRPRPGGTITSAKTSFVSPYGRYAVEWLIDGQVLKVKAEVPPNTSATVDLPGQGLKRVGSGTYQWVIEWERDENWPPKQAPGPSSRQMPDEYVP